ncbi:hypothetical protein C8K38_111228 [Rhodococcus sp. OK611]|uniref:hypothetical protein n=1 Tax=unclassified Rhodococcus (in: high G+C Gram-positive bacteria) TaxID=192944 RepID=UPI000BDCFCEA|nr:MULTISPECIES: hypothetical protein [unclassified Rhodococcus (in: high G+C Gram-positive bacteria)]PTR42059.1 hypothetical protein C8K38_111228 [Rhodococcus sp. OK611]SNX91494.1 hypothetical protein SAMN05447004_11029 [Rhodococcus sp. OK270]
MAITLAQARPGRAVVYRSVVTGMAAERGVIVGPAERGLVLVDYGAGAIHPTHPANLDLIGASN